VLKVGGELTSFQAANCSLEFLEIQKPFSYVRGFPFYTSRWGPLFTYLYRDVLVCSGVLCLRQSASPARSVGSGEAVSGWFSWATGCQVVVPSLVSRSGFGTRSGLGGHLLSCPFIWVPPSVLPLHVLPCVAPDLRTTRPLRGALTRSGDLALSRSLSYWSGVRGSHHYGMRDGARWRPLSSPIRWVM